MPKQTYYDDSRVLYAFQKAPEVFAEEIDHWFNKERAGFLGKQRNRTSTAGIKGKLYHRQTESGEEGWPANYVQQFASYKQGLKTLNETLTMGLIGPNERLHKSLEFQEHGGVIAPGKYMVIPNIKALQYFGIYKQNQALEFFKDHIKDMKMLTPKGGADIFYTMSTSGMSNEKRFGKFKGNVPNQPILFTLRKRVRVHKQFDFSKTWERRYSAIMRRGEEAENRATRKVEKMIREGDILG